MTGPSQISIDPHVLKAAADRVVQRCDRLAEFSEQTDGLTRTFCSPAMHDAHGQLATWMQGAQMECRLDAAGNLIGSMGSRSRNTQAYEDGSSLNPVFMIGSHLDTVVNAGRFDGVLGILLGLAAAEVINETGIDLGFDLHVVAFSEEEGVRYKFPFIGSRSIAGTFDKNDFALVDGNSIQMGDALKQFGCDPDDLESASYANRNLIGFMEAHIEQAELLEEQDVPVGVVSAIAGQTRATIVFEGQSGHAGTVPHDRRHDALAAAAELILKVEQLGRKTDGLFATVGDVIATPGLSNVICGRSELRLDLRHACDEARSKAFDTITAAIQSIAQKRGLTSSFTALDHSPAVPMDDGLSRHFQSAISEVGLTGQSMVSGAGHDAMVMANIAPSCMLFIRCLSGVSHHPDEFVSPQDILIALNVMVRVLLKVSDAN